MDEHVVVGVANAQLFEQKGLLYSSIAVESVKARSWYSPIKILLANCQSRIGKEYEILNKDQRIDETRRKPMSMHPHPIPAIPEETARVARAILPQGNVYLLMRDELGTLYQDEDFRDVFPSRGQPAEVPWRLALVTLMQYA